GGVLGRQGAIAYGRDAARQGDEQSRQRERLAAGVDRLEDDLGGDARHLALADEAHLGRDGGARRGVGARRPRGRLGGRAAAVGRLEDDLVADARHLALADEANLGRDAGARRGVGGRRRRVRLGGRDGGGVRAGRGVRRRIRPRRRGRRVRLRRRSRGRVRRSRGRVAEIGRAACRERGSGRGGGGRTLL